MSFPDLIAARNPWWGRPEARPQAPPLRRSLFETLRKRLSEPDLGRAQVVVGPRQVGKTSLLLQLARHFLDEGWPAPNVTYFDFDDDRLGPGHGLRDVIETRPVGLDESVPRLFLLDEVTRAVRWDTALKQIVDSFRASPPEVRPRLLVTDSAASLVRGGARESLQGRVDEIRIHGLTFGETLHLLAADEETERDVLKRSPGALERYLSHGGLPEHVAAQDQHRSWERIRLDLIDRAIARDLSRDVTDIQPVIALFRALVQDSGGLFEAKNRARDLPREEGTGGDARTVRGWVELLRQASLLDRLDPWHSGLMGGVVKSSRELKARPKLYAEDHGFIPAFSPYLYPMQEAHVLARVFETAVFTHLRSLRDRRKDLELYFYRKKEGVEVDFVLAFADAVLGLEVTSRKDPTVKRRRATRAARQAGIDRLIIVHGGQLEPREDDVAAEWPIDAFLLDPEACIERSLEWIRKSR